MNNRRQYLITLFLLMTMLACVVPGLTSASTPAPGFDTGQLETMVAGTVSAAIAQTKRAAPTGSQPDPVSTVESTATAAPAEATPGTAASSLTPQDDGTILYVDGTARFQLNVSPGWLPVRINEQEYYDAFSLPVAADAAVQRALMNIKTLDPNTFRLFIYDLQDGHMQNGVITNVNFVWDPAGSISLDGEAGIRKAAQDLEVSIPNLSVNSSSVTSTANGLPIGLIISDIPGKTFEGTDVVLFQKQVHLNLPAGTLVISFTTEQNFKDATVPFFDTMVETLKIDPQ